MRLLLQAHKVLIVCAIALADLLVIWGIWQWRRTGDRTSLILAIVALVVSFALVLYLVRVLRRYASRP